MGRGISVGLAALVALAALVSAAPAAAAVPTTRLVAARQVAPGVQRLTYRYGPLTSVAGQGLILLSGTIDHPTVPGFMIRFQGTLVRADGSTPPTEQLHLHHAALANQGRLDPTYPSQPANTASWDRKYPGLPERIFAWGEDKTILTLPAPYGYPIQPSDPWVINYMIHNGTSQSQVVYIQWTLDFVPADSARGRTTKRVLPLWMDVENGALYPVFDSQRGSGGRDGRFTYPDEAKPDPYRSRGEPRLNEWRVPKDMTLVYGWGHIHPGGLAVDLTDRRRGRKELLFRSEARSFDPNGPISWDLAMTATNKNWRVGLRKGDVLRITGTYESRRASWFENMALMGLFYTDRVKGPDAFRSPPNPRGRPTHGHLPENGNHGGLPTGLPDPARAPGQAAPNGTVAIADFRYMPGDLSSLSYVPEVRRGQSIRFLNADGSAQVFHTITSCAPPCNRSTGVSYPIADGRFQFDSRQLGYGPPSLTSAAQRIDWKIPSGLPAGTYTYFCRVHPFMRGAFRVSPVP
jgi:hypothetical protein